MLSALKSKVKEIGDRISSDANALGGRLSSLDVEDIVDPGHKFGPLWERNESRENCRECGIKFQITKHRHHCRSCAGIFCDTCCPITVEDSKGVQSEGKRICKGCHYGEVPHEKFSELIRKQLELDYPSTNEENSVVDKMIDAIRFPSSPGSSLQYNDLAISLVRGSAFPDDHQAFSRSLPVSGYFEIFNKSDEFCCIKVLKKGHSGKFEIPRPSYLAVPPKGYLHGFFDPAEEGYDLFLLSKNPYPVPAHTTIAFDTRGQEPSSRGSLPRLITPCAKVSEFQKISVISINSQNHNVILKYKGTDEVKPRDGCSIGRVGFLGYLQSRRHTDGQIDYSTNVPNHCIRLSYSYNI